MMFYVIYKNNVIDHEKINHLPIVNMEVYLVNDIKLRSETYLRQQKGLRPRAGKVGSGGSSGKSVSFSKESPD